MNVARRVTAATIALLAFDALVASSLWAQEGDRCVFFCAPELKIEPTFTIENIFSRARMEELEDGTPVGTMRQERDTVFELILALDIPTQIPRIGFTFETILIPFGDTSVNPFTGTTAEQLGQESIRNNEIEVELELNITVLEPEQTGGWVETHFDIVDKISPAERPGDASVLTHKLNLELDTAVNIFNWLPDGNWLRHVELEGSLDYLATGLPKAGDLVGTERFLDDASPWSFSTVFVFPLAPLSP